MRKTTRNANGAGSIRQRPNGKWEARICIGTDPKTGKVIRRSIYGNTQKEVRQKMTSIISDLDKGTYQEPTKYTVAEWMKEWLSAFCVNSVKPLTYSSYESIIRNHINPMLGTIKLQSIKGTHIQKLYNHMIDNGSSAKTVKNVSAVLHKAFSIAIKQGYINTNPCDGAALPKAVKPEIKPLSDKEIPIFLQEIENEPMQNAFALCLFAGLREAECLGLSWDQVDFEQQRITICQQLQKEKKKAAKYYIADTTKNGKSRTIAPPLIAFDYLRKERIQQQKNRLAAGELWSNPDNLVFTNSVGCHWAFSTFYKHFKKIAERIGRPDARPHDLRHTAATVAIASGSDIKSIQDLLGHATASFTLNVYTHTSEKMKEDTANRVQDYYDNLSKKA